MHAIPVDGIILAAGLSSRMARPKPLLEVGTVTFLERAADILRSGGCRNIIVVANSAATWLERAQALDLDVVINEDPDSEQVDSLRLALRAVPADTAAVLVLPVDLPLVTALRGGAVVDSFRSDPTALIVPFHNTVAGHPILIGRALFDELLTTQLEEGVRTLIMAHARDMREVRVIDPGVLIDIDTPDDYWRYIVQK
jgi:molybdenum cofactor cytidylyltransferase